jgi:hypothetical protein
MRFWSLLVQYIYFYRNNFQNKGKTMSRFVEFTFPNKKNTKFSVLLEDIWGVDEKMAEGKDENIVYLLFNDSRCSQKIKETYKDAMAIINKADTPFFGAGLTASGLTMLENEDYDAETAKQEKEYREVKELINNIIKERDIYEEALNLACGIKNGKPSCETMKDVLIDRAKRKI